MHQTNPSKSVFRLNDGFAMMYRHTKHVWAALICLTTVNPGLSGIDLADESFDIVTQSTVFSSILDHRFQQDLSNRMWRMVKPRGGILW